MAARIAPAVAALPAAAAALACLAAPALGRSGGTAASGTRAGGSASHARRSARGHGHRLQLRDGENGGSPIEAGAPAHHAPVTARQQSLHYTGPLYERSAGGQVVPYRDPALTSLAGSTSGGAPANTVTPAKPRLLAPGTRARFVDGLAAAPMDAPLAVQRMIWAANRIIGLPYIYGGGHGSFHSEGYDCSGTVSFALHGAGLLRLPEDSSELEALGEHGVGAWVTVFANAGHAYMDIAGLRLDTSPAEDPSGLPGPRWRPLRSTNSGYIVRHPEGL
jgi:cell wall-associated NlpC family hydrolase